MAFNITEISSAINKHGGLAKPNMFFVLITPPRKLLSSDYPRDAMFFCDSAVLPGINFGAQPIRSVGYGTIEQRPIEAGFSQVNTTFIVDANGKAFRFFQQWLALINNWSREPIGIMRGTDLEYGEWNYPTTYEGIVEIHSLNPTGPQGTEIITYQLMKAFPIQVGDISVAWENNDSFMKLPVQFAYNTWNTKNIPQTNPAEDNTLTKGLTILQTSPTATQASYFANSQ